MSADRPDAPGLREAVEALAKKWRGEDDISQWGNHDKTWCARDIEAVLAAHPEPPEADPTAGEHVTREAAGDVEALLCLCHQTMCPVHNEAADRSAEYDVPFLMESIAALLAADRAATAERARREVVDEAESLWAHIDSLRVEYEAKASNPSARFVRAADVVDNLPVRPARIARGEGRG